MIARLRARLAATRTRWAEQRALLRADLSDPFDIPDWPDWPDSDEPATPYIPRTARPPVEESP